MAMMRVMEVREANGPFVMAERPIPEPGPGEVRLKVEACGVCHSDAIVKYAALPGVELPRVPGHEVAGVIDALGSGVRQFAEGDRVGAGWHGGHCFTCDSCRRGRFRDCLEMSNAVITGITRDGGYADYMIARAESLARIPDGLDATAAGPLLCAGITTFNALRNSGARPGDLVAVQGIGGLGHLGVQYARKMGFHTVAISRGADKADLAEKLGAHRYIDAKAEDPVEALQSLGGADVLLATAPNAEAISAVIDGLSARGTLMLVAGAPEPMQVSAFSMLSGRRIHGWPSGSAIDSEDTLNFSALHNIQAQIETYPLEQANDAFERMMSNQVRFRAVLTTG